MLSLQTARLRVHGLSRKRLSLPFAEQYVCQQLVSCCGLEPFYWSADNSRGEIDFIVQRDGATYAIEVKAEENLRVKSLRTFKERNPEVNAVRFSMSGVRDQGWMLNVPLYAMSNARLWMR